MNIRFKYNPHYRDTTPYLDAKTAWGSPECDTKIAAWLKKLKINWSIDAFKLVIERATVNFVEAHPNFIGDQDLRGNGHMSRRIPRGPLGGYGVFYDMVGHIEVNGQVRTFSEYDMFATEWLEIVADGLKVTLDIISREK